MAFHRFLLRLSSRAPDPLLVLARNWLAEGWTTGVAKMLAFTAHTGQFTITEPEAALLTAALGHAGPDWAAAAGAFRIEDGAPLPYRAVDSDRLDGREPAGPDDLDLVATWEVVLAPESAALWRAWRVPALQSLYPRPKRVYLIQARRGLIALTARLQRALRTAGELDPLVEVFDDPATLPEFSRRAIEGGDMLWSERPPRPVRVAPTFDILDRDGVPAFSPARTRLGEPEATAVARYLEAGALLVPGTGDAADVVDPARGTVVPTGLRGDGHWVWAESAHYYLVEHGVAPDEELLAAIQDADYRPPRIDAIDLHHCRAALIDGRP